MKWNIYSHNLMWISQLYNYDLVNRDYLIKHNSNKWFALLKILTLILWIMKNLNISNLFVMICQSIVVLNFKFLVVYHRVHRSAIALYAVASEREDRAAKWNYLKLWIEVVFEYIIDIPLYIEFWCNHVVICM